MWLGWLNQFKNYVRINLLDSGYLVTGMSPQDTYPLMLSQGLSAVALKQFFSNCCNTKILSSRTFSTFFAKNLVLKVPVSTQELKWENQSSVFYQLSKYTSYFLYVPIMQELLI